MCSSLVPRCENCTGQTRCGKGPCLECLHIQFTHISHSLFVCWVALQAPFAGSPIADGVASQDLLRWPSEVALELFGDDGQSLHDHRMDVRGAYLDENAEEIAEIVA